MICKNCVAENSPESKFCSVCGAKLIETSTTVSGENIEVSVEQTINNEVVDTVNEVIGEIEETNEIINENINPIVEKKTIHTSPDMIQGSENQAQPINPLNNNPMNNQNPNYNNQWQYNNQNPSMRKTRPLLSQFPYINLVKQTASSGAFLTMAILSSVALVVSLLTIIFSSNNIGYSLQNIFYYSYQYVPELANIDMFNSLYYIAITTAIIALIPTIINVIGMWLIYASGRSYENRQTAGYTMIKVIAILNLISLSGMVILILGTLILAVIASAGGAGANVVVLLIVIMIILILAITVPVLQNIAIIKIINNVKAVLNNYAPKKISMMLPVLNYIIAGCSVVMFFSINFISVGINIAILIIGAIIISKYNKNLFQLSYNMNSYNNQANNQNNQVNNMQNNY